MKVLCLNPPSEKGLIRNGRWVRRSRGNQNWYPIWLAYLTGFLQKHDFNVGLLDASAQNISEEICYLYIKEVIKPDVIVAYWAYDTEDLDLTFCDKLANFSKVILVGPWSFCNPNALLKTKKINILTYGEFEYTILELLSTNHYTDVKGVIWRNHIDGKIYTNPPRPLCSTQDLDEMPFVTSIYKEFLNLDNYRQTSLKFNFVDTLTARGCNWGRCTYCQWVNAFQNGPSYRPRSIKNIIDELWFIKNNLLKVKQIFFQTDNLQKHHVTELSQAILSEKLNICWGGYSRAELDYTTLKLMKESGCRTLHIGYESPIQSNLDIINKGLTVEQMKEFADNIKKLNMWTSATFMLFPWMKEKEIKFTIKWAKSIKPKRMNFIQAQAYPNTPFAKTLEELNKKQQLMTFKEMEKWEKWGFKRFYIYNSSFLFDVLKHPKEWKQVLNDAGGLLKFLDN